MPKACSDRSPRTADAGIYDGMGVLCPWFLREGSDRAGRAELMPKLAEACVESGSGLGFLVECPSSRSANRRGYFGGAIRIVVFGASVSFGFCGLMLFWWFSVGLKTFDCSFAFDLSELIAPLGLQGRTSLRAVLMA